MLWSLPTWKSPIEMINREIVIKHFDILLENIDDISHFDVNGIMTKYGDFKHDIPKQNMMFRQICESVKRFGKTYGYIDSDPKRPKLFFLSRDGIKAKELGGHKKFQDSLNKKEWYNENWVGYLIAFIVFLFSVYQYFENDSLKNRYDSLESEYDLYKDSVVDSKEQFELHKTNSLKDTLQTKSSADLKTD
ncbi:hypothetical protein R3X25_15140 [Lutibacter sp. TH_r2]|uniref:hypothetical protein n=1 Tax=Lutibacter sp. TH_r2 TaxID=3082083 RepID=UPI00295393CC|nr:hypothetical protein [Lutibacter sp. TH_r2]MDV7188616.1 hypothetical protein [Lutibacter sp. TH_r2]